MRRRKDKIDENQPEIVKKLRQIGLSVEVGHDDILVGFRGKTYWYEIKTSEKSHIKDSQKKLLKSWRGHYKIVWTLDQILKDIGVV